jgi:uncharacterized protein (DUF1330 family)
MFNALWFRPDGGAERYAEYGAAVLPILAGVGAELLYPFLRVERALEGGLDPDLVGFVRYPSWEAFTAMWQSDAYQAIAQLREEAITKAILTQCRMDPVDVPAVANLRPGIAVLDALWFRDGAGVGFDKYLADARPLVEAHGGVFLAPRLKPERSLGEEFLPDLMLLSHYPAVQAPPDLTGSAAYEPLSALRAAALSRAATTVLRIDG